MARNEEGGVSTQKIIAAIAVFAMMFAAGAVLLGDSSDVDGASSVLKGDTNVVKPEGELKYQIMFYESEEFDTLEIAYTAVLTNSNGSTQSNAVTPANGTMTNGVETELTIKAPAAPGKYTLTVTFTETIDDGDEVKSERTQTITVLEPIKLTSTLKNNSKVDFTDFAVYFIVDGVMIEGSKTLVSVASGATTTVSYDWVTESISNGEHSFEIVAGEENIGDYKDVILGAKKNFYVGNSDYGIFDIVLVLLLIVFAIILVYLYRKPVKNYGKPKSRR